MKFDKKELIKSPLNYTGGKYKLLPQILPYFPEEIDTFYDLFGGGGDVSVNVKANKIIYNDKLKELKNILSLFKTNTYEYVIGEINNIIHKYDLSESNIYGYEYYGCNSNDGLAKYNKNKLNKLRENYNSSKTKNYIELYVLLMYSYCNYFKIDCNGNFINTSPNKRDFNNNLINKLYKFIKALNNKNIEFYSNDYDKFNINKKDFVYLDPPYLITKAFYNNNWNSNNENDLLNFIDKLNDKGVRFALSNVLENKGKSNDILKEWSKKYKVIHLNNTYKNCSHNVKDKSNNTTDEVLIINY